MTMSNMMTDLHLIHTFAIRNHIRS